MQCRKVIAIAACDPNGVIGKGGVLPWDLKEERDHFSAMIGQFPIVMGRKTFESIPHHYLQSRPVIVLSRTISSRDSNVIFVSSLESFLMLPIRDQLLFVIGGAAIYSLFLLENLIDEFILTQIKECYPGDTFFPLHLIKRWTKQCIRDVDGFTIYRYLPPASIEMRRVP
jgi:dihydrofolate reductase